MKTILHISATPAAHSVTAKLADYMLETLQNRYEDSHIHTRNVFTGLDAAHQTETLSAELVKELKHCDILLISSPYWNFSIPASLKAWIDLVVKPNETFKFHGPSSSEGLLKGKQAIIVTAMGGYDFNTEHDFLSPYLTKILQFIGFEDIKIFAATGTKIEGAEQSLNKATNSIKSAEL